MQQIKKAKLLIMTFLGTAAVSLFAKGISVISGIIYARYLGPEQYGLYAYVMSILALLAIPSIAGLPDLVVREISKLHSEQRWSYLSGIIKWSRWYVLSVSFITIIISTLLLHYQIFSISVASLLAFAIVTLPFQGLLNQQGAILNGFKRPVLAQIPGQILSPLIMLFVVLFCIFNNVVLTADLIIKISVITSLLGFALSVWFLRKVINNIVKINKRNYFIKQWQKSLVPFSLIAVIGTLNAELASIFLAYFKESESVAYFKVAMQSVILITIGLKSINAVIMPDIAVTFKKGNLKKTQRLLTKSVRLSCLFSMPILLFLLMFGDIVIIAFFGEAYLPAYPVLIILCVGQLFNILMGSVGLVLNMTNNEKHSLKTLVATLFVFVTLLCILIPMFSIVGAAISVSCSMILWNVLMAVDVWKLTKLKTWLC